MAILEAPKWIDRLLRDVVPFAKSLTVSPAVYQRIKEEAVQAELPLAFTPQTALIVSPFMTDEQVFVVDRRGRPHIVRIIDLLAPDFKSARWEW